MEICIAKESVVPLVITSYLHCVLKSLKSVGVTVWDNECLLMFLGEKENVSSEILFKPVTVVPSAMILRYCIYLLAFLLSNASVDSTHRSYCLHLAAQHC